MPVAPDPSRSRVAWLLRLAAGLLIFWLAFRDVDPSAVGRAFRLVHPAWLAAAILSVFLTVGCVVARWRVLLGATARLGQTPTLFSAVIASQVANIVMPFRLGDAVRIGGVSRAFGIPASEVLGTVAIERLFDALLVAVTAVLLVALGTLPAFAHRGMIGLAIAVCAAFIAAAAVLHVRSRGNDREPAPARPTSGSAPGWLSMQTDLLLRGLQRVSRPEIAGLAFLWSCAVVSGSILTAWLVLRALDLSVPAVSAAVIVIAVQIGSVVVPIPGAIGVSQVITVQTLRLWDVAEAPALAYALMLYLVSRVPKLAVLPFALSVLSVEKSPGLKSPEPALKSRPTDAD